MSCVILGKKKCDLRQEKSFSLASSDTTFWLIHSSHRVLFLFLQHSKLTPASEHLHLLFPLPGTLFPALCMTFPFSSIRSQVKCHFFRDFLQSLWLMFLPHYLPNIYSCFIFSLAHLLLAVDLLITLSSTRINTLWELPCLSCSSLYSNAENNI